MATVNELAEKLVSFIASQKEINEGQKKINESLEKGIEKLNDCLAGKDGLVTRGELREGKIKSIEEREASRQKFLNTLLGGLALQFLIEIVRLLGLSFGTH